jgi:hypothetical protein
MKHSGLQKSISSIFDGNEPIKQEKTPTVWTAASQNPVAVAAMKPQPVGPTETPPVTDVVSPTAVATLQSTLFGSTASASTTARPATRPRPVTKKNTNARNTISMESLWTTLKSKLNGGSKKSLDSRQKKTLILGITLAVVFVVVLLFVLGSGPSGVKAAPTKTGSVDSSAAGTQSGNIDNWQKPEIYPMSLRDPMKPSSNAAKVNGQEGEMTVRGIVYSSSKPTAIIADQIVGEGDVIVGVKIIKIGKDFVAFEKDGKRWQQQVRQ